MNRRPRRRNRARPVRALRQRRASGQPGGAHHRPRVASLQHRAHGRPDRSPGRRTRRRGRRARRPARPWRAICRAVRHSGRRLSIDSRSTTRSTPRHITRTGQGISTNPFWNNNANANRSKVWAYGVRNSYRFNPRPTNGVPYIGDVGWNSCEEVNVASRGANLGWPCYQGDSRQGGYGALFIRYNPPGSETRVARGSRRRTRPGWRVRAARPHGRSSSSAIMACQ